MAQVEQKIRYDIKAGMSPKTLDEFARQSRSAHVFVVYKYSVKSRTNAIHGEMTPIEAAGKLLSGRRLECAVLNHGRSISIRLLEERQASRSQCTVEEEPPLSEQQGPTQSPGKTMDVVRVVSSIGTHRRGSHEIGGRVQIWDEDQIEQSGANTVADLVRVMTQDFLGGPSEDTHFNGEETRSNSGLGVGANFRGLGARATLVLMNGRRVAPSGSDGSFVDLLGFPISVVKRVEVLMGGASALYGSDAVGAVVNIVTKDDFIGAQTFAGVGSVTQGSQEQDRLSQIWGSGWDGGNVVFGVERWHRGALPTQDRAQASSDLEPFHGPNLNSPYSNPGNLITSAGVIPIPAGQNGIGLDLSALSTGAPNLVNRYAGADIVPDQRRDSFFAAVNQSLNDHWTLTGNLLLAERHAAERLGGAMVNLDVTGSPLLVNLPSGPIQEEYDLADDLGPRTTDVTVRTVNYSVGVAADLGHGWQFDATGGGSLESESQLTRGQADPVALQNAINAGTFNPLGDGSYTNTTILTGIETTPSFGVRSELRDFTANFDGPVAKLPGGLLGAAVGVEYRDQWFETAASAPGMPGSFRRVMGSAYTEWGIPIFGPGNAQAGLQALEISGALRYEHYSDFGPTTAPRVGVQWSPLKGLELRGSWSRSQREPNLGDLNEKNNVSFLSPQQSSPSSIPVQTLVWSGSNASLTAERATTRMFGAHFTAGSFPALSLDIDYFDILFKNRIQGTDFSSGLLFDPQYQGIVVRNPSTSLQGYVCDHSTYVQTGLGDCRTAPIAAILDLRLMNMATVWTDGLDFSGGLDFDSGVGQFGIGLNATYILDFKQSAESLAPLTSVLNTQTNPINLHAVLSINWKWRGIQASTSTHYQNSYRDVSVSPVRNVGSWTTVDLNLSYERDDTDAGWLRNTRFGIGVQNLFQRYPPFVIDTVANIGYDQENGDLTGRVVSASIRKRW